MHVDNEALIGKSGWRGLDTRLDPYRYIVYSGAHCPAGCNHDHECLAWCVDRIM